MATLEEAITAYEAEAERIYNACFSEYFSSVHILKDRLYSEKRPITDSELEEVLTNLPLNLFLVAEKMEQLKLRVAIVNKYIKDRSYEFEHSPDVTKKDIPHLLSEEKFKVDMYTIIIERAQSEVSIAKELIMACKKLWDARRKIEESNPVQPPKQNSLPKSYISGV